MPTFMWWSCSALSSRLSNLALRCSYNSFRAKTELLQQLLKRCRGSKAFDTDVVTLGAGVFAPAKVGCLLHRHPSLHVWGQNRFPVAFILNIKQLPRRHANHPCPHALLLQLLVSLHAEGNFAPSADENHLWVSTWGIRENVSPASQTRGRAVLRPVDCRYGLAGEYKHRRLVM